MKKIIINSCTCFLIIIFFEISDSGNLFSQGRMDNEQIRQDSLKAAKSKLHSTLRKIDELKTLIVIHDSIKMIPEKQKELAEISTRIIHMLDSTFDRSEYYRDIQAYTSLKGSYWDRIDFLVRSNENSEEIPELLLKGLNSDLKAGNYISGRKKGANYKKYFKSNFELRFKYASICIKAGFPGEALAEYQWLMDNWKKQDYLRWEDALDVTNQLYLSVSNFEKSMNLSRRMMTEFKNIKYTNAYLLAIRLLSCDAVAQSFRISDQSNSPDFRLDDFLKDTPPYINGILVSNKGKIAEVIYAKNTGQYNLGDVVKNVTQEVILDSEYKFCRYQKKINGSKIIVFEINSEYLPDESGIIRVLTNKPSGPEGWKLLAEMETHVAFRFMSILIAHRFFNTKELVSLKSYDRLITSRPEIAYIVFHRKDGSEERINYNIKLAEYPEGHYAKSSQALAFYMKEVQYDGKNVYEMLVPLYDKKIWAGSFRMGVKKL